jgi:hypothetical protein
MQEVIDKSTEELGEYAKKAMANFKGDEFRNPDGSFKNPPPLKEETTWVERAEDEEVKQHLEASDKEWFGRLRSSLKEGEDFTNFEPFSDDSQYKQHPEFVEQSGGIQGSGTYVLRDGKLVKGEGRKREEVMFSNWY